MIRFSTLITRSFLFPHPRFAGSIVSQTPRSFPLENIKLYCLPERSCSIKISLLCPTFWDGDAVTGDVLQSVIKKSTNHEENF